jgi:opacity protein-like surface antigen
MKKLAIAAFALAAMTSAAAARDWNSGDRIDQRQFNQQRRIEEGVRSGDITRSEYQHLQAEQARIREMERQAKRDGYVDPKERARLEAAQDAASRHIRQERHDAERRGYGYWGRDGYQRQSWWSRRWW